MQMNRGILRNTLWIDYILDNIIIKDNPFEVFCDKNTYKNDENK